MWLCLLCPDDVPFFAYLILNRVFEINLRRWKLTIIWHIKLRICCMYKIITFLIIFIKSKVTSFCDIRPCGIIYKSTRYILSVVRSSAIYNCNFFSIGTINIFDFDTYGFYEKWKLRWNWVIYVFHLNLMYK